MNQLDNQNQPGQEEKDTETAENSVVEEQQRISPRYRNFRFIVSPISAAFIGLFGGFILYQFIGSLLTILVLGYNFDKTPANSQRLMTAAGQILFILLPALIFSRIFYRDVGYIIRAKAPRLGEIAIFLFGIIVLTPLLQSFQFLQNYAIEALAKNYSVVKDLKSTFDWMNNMLDETYHTLLTVHNAFEGVLVIIVVAFVPALCEEVMFRGFIQKSFELKIKPFWAALITAVFFGLYHFNPYGLIPLIGLGLYFGFAAYMSNSIVVPIILHFFNNFTAVIFYFIFGNEDLIKNNTTPNVDIWYSVISFLVLLVIFVSVIFVIKKYYSNSVKEQEDI
jgi:membrane protease YdiL (CAAX protease family)